MVAQGMSRLLEFVNMLCSKILSPASVRPFAINNGTEVLVTVG